jgi:hypothetical protein
MPTKTFRAKLNADLEGVVTAIAFRPARTLDDARPIIVDHDKEIIGPHAIKDGAKMYVSEWGHSVIGGSPPVASGTVRIVDGAGIVMLQYWPDVARSWDAYLLLKHLGESVEWSIGFRTLKEGAPTEAQRKLGAQRVLLDLDLVEVSPVARGAQRSTATVSTRQDPAIQDPELQRRIVAEFERFQRIQREYRHLLSA